MTRGWQTTGRGVLAGLVVMATAAVMAWGRPGVVTTKQGDKFEGDVTERGNAVTIKPANGQPVTMNKANVANIQYGAATTADQFRERLAKLGKDDVAGRIALARSAVDQGEWDLAIDALDAALAIDPNNEQAIQMRRSVTKQRTLARRAGGKAGKPPAGETMPPEDAATPPARPGERPARDGRPAADPPAADRGKARAKPIRQVTPAEINRIRQLEVQPDEKVQIRFEQDVRRKYQQSSEFTPQEFAALTPQQQAMEILKNGSRRMHEHVIIATDPASISQFKQGVHRNVLSGCAAASCHGTRDKAGDFFLHSPASKEADLYTNFLLIQDYKATIDDRDYLMIDRARPENSLLLQYGLPPDAADVPHPEAQNYRPLYKGKSDPKYRQAVDWMSRTLAPVAPEYGVDLTKEPGEEDGGGATTRPARGDRRPPRENADR